MFLVNIIETINYENKRKMQQRHLESIFTSRSSLKLTKRTFTCVMLHYSDITAKTFPWRFCLCLWFSLLVLVSFLFSIVLSVLKACVEQLGSLSCISGCS